MHLQQMYPGTQSYGGGMSGQGGQYGQQGYNTLRQFGTNPQDVRNHMSETMQSTGYHPGTFGAQGYGASPMNAYTTDPQVVRQHIQQDLGYAQGGYGVQGGYASSPMHAYATDPQLVRQHIQQDLGYAHQGGQQLQGMHQGYGASQMSNTGVVHQVMQAVPAQVHGMQGQQMGYGVQSNAQSTFGQYGTNPQTVQQHIQSDLNNQVGQMSSYQAGYQQGGQYGQSMQAGAYGQFGTNPQTVRQHIGQDLGYYQ